MENGICSLREIEKLCRNDIRYMYLLDGMKTPSFATFGNLIRNELTDSIEQIFEDINSYIFAKDHVDLQHTYIDGTKIEANANRYTWVWKKSCVKNRQKVFDKISLLIDAMNREVLGYLGIKFEKREILSKTFCRFFTHDFFHTQVYRLAFASIFVPSMYVCCRST